MPRPGRVGTHRRAEGGCVGIATEGGGVGLFSLSRAMGARLLGADAEVEQLVQGTKVAQHIGLHLHDGRGHPVGSCARLAHELEPSGVDARAAATPLGGLQGAGLSWS